MTKTNAPQLPEEGAHTPGPWDWNDLSTITANGSLGTVCIAEVYNPQWQHMPPKETRKANARLIAAAPALLAAVEAIHQGFMDGSIKWTKKRQSESDPYHPANTLMSAALDKVKGCD